MIHHLNNLLRHLLLTHVADLTTEAQIRFRPPDEDWRTEVLNLQQMALNIYLTDLRENRKLRSNQRERVGINGRNILEQPAPARVNCHYLITAWSPTIPGPAVEPTSDEHALLYDVMAVLFNTPIIPTQIYPPALLNTLPALLRDAELPAQLLPVEGFNKLSEFWGTMGSNYRWKPAIYLTVTLPVAYNQQSAGPIVTTRVTEFRHSNSTAIAEIGVQIAGTVINDSDQAVPNALVDVLGTGLRARTDANGRYHFLQVPVGTYSVRTVAVGYQPNTVNIEIPNTFSNYDITLTTLP